MTAAVEIFRYADQQVRTVLVGGEPRFVLADLCSMLDLTNPTTVAGRLDGDDLSTAEVIDSMGRTQTVRVVSESGVNDLVLDSRKPDARRIRRWLTREVMPAIRRTGSYGAPMVDVEALDRRALARMVIEAEDAREALALENAELRPKADLADTFLTARPQNRLVREVAKVLGLREKDLRAFLVEERLVFPRQATCGQMMYDHYAAYAAHFHPVERVVDHRFGACSHYTLTITPRGVDLIRRRLADRAAALAAAGGDRG